MFKRIHAFFGDFLLPAIITGILGLVAIFGFAADTWNFITLGLGAKNIQVVGISGFVVCVLWILFRFHVRLSDVATNAASEKPQRLGGRSQEKVIALNWLATADKIAHWYRETEKEISGFKTTARTFGGLAGLREAQTFERKALVLFEKLYQLQIDEFFSLAHKRGLTEQKMFVVQSMPQVRFVERKLRFAARALLRENGVDPDETKSEGLSSL